jgi:hypothetical protein
MAEKYADVMTTDQCLQALGALGSAQKETVAAPTQAAASG